MQRAQHLPPHHHLYLINYHFPVFKFVLFITTNLVQATVLSLEILQHLAAHLTSTHAPEYVLLRAARGTFTHLATSLLGWTQGKAQAP